MVTIATEPPLRAEGRGSFTVASYNIQSSSNGGLESALQAMKLMGVDCDILLETKVTEGGLHTLEQRLQPPIHPCAEQVARRDWPPLES